ncbi:MAG: D-tyrosyl-tRNA(Tyr) deacylase [Verrucomicrobia bacterium]|nr:D-tyrosyl-tRNA(Tyr) deacylase [Verrucomicrobiota bacterium]
MRAVVQRVSEASVLVEGEVVGQIGSGLLVFLGIAPTDTPEDRGWLAAKLVNLRVFDDDAGVMNRSVRDVVGEILLVSQFTLLASTRKGTRPSWSGAARPEFAQPEFEAFHRELQTALGRPIPTGIFGATMEIRLVNQGPVTVIVDSYLKE